VSDVLLTAGASTSRLARNMFKVLPFPRFEGAKAFFGGDFRTFGGEPFRPIFGDGIRTFERWLSLSRLGLKDSSKLSSPSFEELELYAYVRSRDLD